MRTLRAGRTARNPKECHEACCGRSGLLLALLGPCERELSWAALWGKADVLRLGLRLPSLTHLCHRKMSSCCAATVNVLSLRRRGSGAANDRYAYESAPADRTQDLLDLCSPAAGPRKDGNWPMPRVPTCASAGRPPADVAPARCHLSCGLATISQQNPSQPPKLGWGCLVGPLKLGK